MADPNLRELLRRPVVVAPMAGGPSTPSLVGAAADAGAFAFLAAGYKTAAAMVAEITAVRAATAAPFGVNVFVPGVPTRNADALSAYLDTLGADADAVGAPLGEPTWDDDQFDEKIAALLADPPSVVSFTFGCPSAELIGAFRGDPLFAHVTLTRSERSPIAALAASLLELPTS